MYACICPTGSGAVNIRFQKFLQKWAPLDVYKKSLCVILRAQIYLNDKSCLFHQQMVLIYYKHSLNLNGSSSLLRWI